MQAGRYLIAVAEHGPPHHVAVAVQVLGRRVDHDVGAERERPLEHRGCERVVHRHQQVPVVRQRAHLGHRSGIEKDAVKAFNRVGLKAFGEIVRGEFEKELAEMPEFARGLKK